MSYPSSYDDYNRHSDPQPTRKGIMRELVGSLLTGCIMLMLALALAGCSTSFQKIDEELYGSKGNVKYKRYGIISTSTFTARNYDNGEKLVSADELDYCTRWPWGVGFDVNITSYKRPQTLQGETVLTSPADKRADVPNQGWSHDSAPAKTSESKQP